MVAAARVARAVTVSSSGPCLGRVSDDRSSFAPRRLTYCN